MKEKLAEAEKENRRLKGQIESAEAQIKDLSKLVLLSVYLF